MKKIEEEKLEAMQNYQNFCATSGTLVNRLKFKLNVINELIDAEKFEESTDLDGKHGYQVKLTVNLDEPLDDITTCCIDETILRCEDNLPEGYYYAYWKVDGFYNTKFHARITLFIAKGENNGK